MIEIPPTKKAQDQIDRSEAGAAAEAAGPRRPGLALPWQRLREGPARGSGVNG